MSAFSAPEDGQTQDQINAITDVSDDRWGATGHCPLGGLGGGAGTTCSPMETYPSQGAAYSTS